MAYSECNMNNLNYISLNIEGNLARLTLDRPEKHNAIFPELIKEIRTALSDLQKRTEISFLVLSGAGASFCSGADIDWFSKSVEQSKIENWEEYLEFAELLKQLNEQPQITIAAVHKNVLGGGSGLMAACDFAVAERSTAFAFTELKLGLIPATIMPFVAKRISVQNMKKLFFSAERFWASEAQLIGLVDFLSDDGKLMSTVDELIGGLSSVSPGALKACKKLIGKVTTGEVGVNSSEYTATVLADMVHSDEGQEGMRAFLEKRIPDWSVFNELKKN